MSSAAAASVAAVLRVCALFVAAGVLEIGGGWLVWGYVREGRPAWWAALGGAALVGYGFVATAQTTVRDFARLDAAYGGVFICLSFLWGRAVDGLKLDLGDLLGGMLSVAGAAVVLAWPR